MSNLVFNLAVWRWHLQFENRGFRPRLSYNALVKDPPTVRLYEFSPWRWRPFAAGWLPR